MTQADKIAALLSKGALTVADIRAATGLSENHVRAILCRSRWRFVNIQPGQRAGRWGLLAPALRGEET